MDPLSSLDSLINYDVLKRILYDILGQLNRQGSRIEKLEKEFQSLNDSSSLLKGGLNDLNALAARLQGSESAIQELKNGVKELQSGYQKHEKQLTDISREVENNASALKDFSASSNSLLDRLMKEKADKRDVEERLSELAAEKNNEQQFVQSQLEELNARLEEMKGRLGALGDENDKAAGRAEIEGKFGEFKSELDAMRREIEEMRAAMADKLGKSDVDDLMSQFLGKVKELEKALNSAMKSELRRFEKDVMRYIQEHAGKGSSSGGPVSGSALASVYYRCLLCQNITSDMSGAQTERYAKSKHAHQHTHVHAAPAAPSIPFAPSVPSIAIPHSPAPIAPNEDSVVEIDNQVYIHGTDGNIYRGRRNQEDGFSGPASPHQSRPTSAATPYRPMSAGSASRPYRPLSTDPSRYRGDIDPVSGRRSQSPGRPFESPVSAPNAAWDEKQTPQSMPTVSMPPSEPVERSLFFSNSEAVIKKKGKKALKPRPPSAKK